MCWESVLARPDPSFLQWFCVNEVARNNDFSVFREGCSLQRAQLKLLPMLTVSVLIEILQTLILSPLSILVLLMTRKKDDCSLRRCLYPVIMHSFAMTAVSGAWINSQTLPQPGFNYVSAYWESSTTCLAVGSNSKGGAVLRSTDSGHTWNAVTGTNGIQKFMLTDIAAAGPSKVNVVTGRNLGGDKSNGVVYTSGDGITFSTAKISTNGGHVSPFAGLNGAAVAYTNIAFVVGVGGKIYRSNFDFNAYDYSIWTDVSLTSMKVMRSLRCCTTFIWLYDWICVFV